MSDTEQAPEKKGPNLRFWRSQWTAAEKAGETHKKDTKAAWDEFLSYRTPEKAGRGNEHRGYPLYWASVRVMQPALYCRTPNIVIERAFEALKDPVARLASTMGERLGKYLVRSCPFDRTFYSVRDNYIHGAKTTARIIFDAKIGEKPSRKYYSPAEMMGEDGEPAMHYVGDDGQPFEGDKLQQDERGYYAETIEETIDSTSISVIPPHYADYLHTPNARHWEEIDWIRFRTPMTKPDCIKRFGEEVCAKLKFQSLSEDKDKEVEGTIPTRVAFIGETWDKQTKQVYWDCEGYDEDFLDIKDDPYELEGFFPCTPFMLGTCGPDNLYPTPDFIQLKPFIDQLHGCADRFRRLVIASKVMGIYDANQDILKALENLTVDALFLGVKDMQGLLEKGGLSNLVQYFPIEKITQAINEMAQIINAYEQKFYELYGIPDILRGISDPRETAAAQQEKGKFISGMFQATQREFQRVVRDAIEMMVDLALRRFPVQIIAEIVGFQFMPPEEQQLFPQALALLQNDRQRLIRINIETDSTHTMNENADIEQANYLGKTLFEGISSMAPVLRDNPQFAPVMYQTLLFIIRQVRHGKQIEEPLEQAMQAAMQPKPEAPDPAMAKVQGQIQIEQQKAQSQMQIAQMKAQTDAQLAMQKAQIEAELESRQAQHKMMLEQADAQNQQQLAAVEMQTALVKAQAEAALEEKRAENDLVADKMKVIGDIAAKKAAGPEQKAPSAMTVNFRPNIQGAE